MPSLFEMAQALEARGHDHGNAMEAALVQMEIAAEQNVPVEVPETIAADAALVRAALENGGKVEVTVRSKKTGDHVYVTLTCKKGKPGGGFVSRATAAGRIGLAEATIVDASDPNKEWPENRIGTYSVKRQHMNVNAMSDPKRGWAATKILAWVRGEFDMLAVADVFVATRCCRCGRKLKHPESVSALVGPECRNKANQGQHAAYVGTVA